MTMKWLRWTWNKDGLWLRATLDVDGAEQVLWFTCTNEAAKDAVTGPALRDALNADFPRSIEAIRRAEYEQGWKDAKAKKDGKCGYFMTSLLRRASCQR